MIVPGETCPDTKGIKAKTDDKEPLKPPLGVPGLGCSLSTYCIRPYGSVPQWVGVSAAAGEPPPKTASQDCYETSTH